MLTKKEAEELKYKLHTLADMYIKAAKSVTNCFKTQAQIRASNLIATYNTIKHLISASFNSDIIPAIITEELITNAQVDAQRLLSEINIDCESCGLYSFCFRKEKATLRNTAEVTHG